ATTALYTLSLHDALPISKPCARVHPGLAGPDREDVLRCRVTVANERRILCVFPAYAHSFGTFSHAYRLMWRVGAFMPPQGLLAIDRKSTRLNSSHLVISY